MAATPSKQIHLELFEWTQPTTGGLWAHPDNQSHRLAEPQYWIELAQTLEEAKVDFLFFPDSYGYTDVNGQRPDIASTDALDLPRIDPGYLVAIAAQSATRLGFAMTGSTTFEPPFSLARRLGTLDLLTSVRLGWNVVTSGFAKSAAGNFGQQLIPSTTNVTSRSGVPSSSSPTCGPGPPSTSRSGSSPSCAVADGSVPTTRKARSANGSSVRATPGSPVTTPPNGPSDQRERDNRNDTRRCRGYDRRFWQGREQGDRLRGDLIVRENVRVGRHAVNRLTRWINTRNDADAVRATFAFLGIDGIDPSTKVATLPPSGRVATRARGGEHSSRLQGSMS